MEMRGSMHRIKEIWGAVSFTFTDDVHDGNWHLDGYLFRFAKRNMGELSSLSLGGQFCLR